jgi:hypothetical protein
VEIIEGFLELLLDLDTRTISSVYMCTIFVFLETCSITCVASMLTVLNRTRLVCIVSFEMAMLSSIWT